MSTVPEDNMSIARGKKEVDEWHNYSRQNINPYFPFQIFLTN